MRDGIRRAGLMWTVVLVLALVTAGLAVAQEGDGGPPFAADEVDTGFFTHFDEETGTLTWSIYEFETQEDFEAACVDGSEADERCHSTTGEMDTHGDVVSAFVEANPEEDRTPGFGCLVAEVAQGDYGLKGDEGDEASAEAIPENAGCPEGLYLWLQTFAGADENGEDNGPPDWVPVPDEARDRIGSDDVEAEGQGDGPPDWVPGPPPGAGGRP